MTPCLNTGEKHEQIKVKLLHDAELIATEYGINIFSFHNFDFHNSPEK